MLKRDNIVTVDRLSALLERFRVRAHLFHTGPLCGSTLFAAEPGRAFLHVMHRGEMVVSHRARTGVPARVVVQEPTLLFYPRPLAHTFRNAPADGSDFVCATLDFDGGDAHPLVRALPPVVVLPLRTVAGIESTLALLFTEAEHVRCGRRLVADRLLEVLILQLLRWMLDHPDEARLPRGLLTGLAEPRLSRTLVAMHERPQDPWTLASMARTAGMSRSSFAVIFRQRVGQTPGDYLLRWRVSIAQTLLRSGAPVKLVSDQLGYQNAATLARAFKQVVGHSPRAWQRAHAT